MAIEAAYDENQIRQMEQRLKLVNDQIAEACDLAGRSPDEITLIGVSKRFPAQAAMAAVRLGLNDLGENRVQELVAKIDTLAQSGLLPHWHLIGTLQKNKVRHVVGKTHLIHSVDSLSLLDEISRRSQDEPTSLLLQVNTSGELSKHGFDPADLEEAVVHAGTLSGVRLCGLMTMAPLFDNPEKTIPVFEKTRQIFESLRGHLADPVSWQVLSMGMSGDFVQAIRCGATHIRIGTAIFGQRL